MRKDLADITLVVDRSGSMHACQSDAEGGINQFVKDQKAGGGEALFTLVQFDTEYDFIHKGVPIAQVGEYRLVPRGQTALLDAVGRAIVETGERLDKMDEANRPGCVVFVIVTDGHENSSKEFQVDKIREMITRQQDDYQWQFTFLGADAQAFDEAMRMGVRAAGVAVYDAEEKTSGAFAAASSSVSRVRSATARGGKAVSCFSQNERDAIK